MEGGDYGGKGLTMGSSRVGISSSQVAHGAPPTAGTLQKKTSSCSLRVSLSSLAAWAWLPFLGALASAGLFRETQRGNHSSGPVPAACTFMLESGAPKRLNSQKPTMSTGQRMGSLRDPPAQQASCLLAERLWSRMQ